MSEIYAELEAFFTSSSRMSKAGYCPLKSAPDAYCYCNESEWAVLMAGNCDESFVEHFSKMVLKYGEIQIDNRLVNGLRLSCEKTKSMDIFLTIAEKFLSLDQSKKNALFCNPSVWTDEIKEIIGNKNYKKTTYQIIGELILLKKLLSMGCKAYWTGPDGGVVDVETEQPRTVYFEVKTTTLRNTSAITLSEEYQPEKADYLCFYRFEEDPLGEYSIKTLMSDIISLGFDEYLLNKKIEKTHVRNTSELSTKYHLLDEYCYKIDENFPKITDLYPNGIKPPHFEKIQCQLLLSGLEQCDFPIFSR